MRFPRTLQLSGSLEGVKPAAISASPDLLTGPFPAVVLNTEETKESLGMRTVLNSLSATSFCIQLNRQLEFGKNLLVITQLSHAILLLRAEVTDIKQNQNGSYCACLRIKQHQIFSSLTIGQALNINDPSAQEAPSSESFPRLSTSS